MQKSDAIRLRVQVQSLAKEGLSVSSIACRLCVSRLFVRRWKAAIDVSIDARGWEKGKKRKYTTEQEECVLSARMKAEKGFFLEHRVFRQQWKKKYPYHSSNGLSMHMEKVSIIRKNKKADHSTCCILLVFFRQLVNL